MVKSASGTEAARKGDIQDFRFVQNQKSPGMEDALLQEKFQSVIPQHFRKSRIAYSEFRPAAPAICVTVMER